MARLEKSLTQPTRDDSDSPPDDARVFISVDAEYVALKKEAAAKGLNLDLSLSEFIEQKGLRRELARVEKELAATREQIAAVEQESAPLKAEIAAITAETESLRARSADLKNLIAGAEKNRTPTEAAAIAEAAAESAGFGCETKLVKAEIQDLQAQQSRDVWCCRLLYGIAGSRSLLPPLRADLKTNDPAFSNYLTDLLNSREKAPAPPPPRLPEVELNPPLARFLPTNQND